MLVWLTMSAVPLSLRFAEYSCLLTTFTSFFTLPPPVRQIFVGLYSCLKEDMSILLLEYKPNKNAVVRIMEVKIKVREGYSIPPVYQGVDEDVETRETALTIGAICVDYVKRRAKTDTIDEQHRLKSELEDLKARFNTESTIKGERIAKGEIDIARRMMNAEIELLKAQNMTLLENERQRLRKQFEEDLKRYLTDMESKLARIERSMMLLEKTTSTRKESSSSNLGKEFEESVESYIRQVYASRPGFKLEDVRHAGGGKGDFILEYDGLKIMIELKNYASGTKVPTKEVEKLVRDVSSVSDSGGSKISGAIMISANSEITGHYSCGNFEMSTSLVVGVPILFVNNFMSTGDPHVSLHMIRVFLDMVVHNGKKGVNEETVGDEEDESVKLKHKRTECIQRCGEFINDLNKQVGDLLKQATILQNTSISLKKSISVLVENEIAKFESIQRLFLLHSSSSDNDDVTGKNVFRPSHTLTDDAIALINMMIKDFDLLPSTSTITDCGDEYHCATKDLITYIQTKMNCGDKRSREMIKLIFLDHHTQHRGYVTGIRSKK